MSVDNKDGCSAIYGTPNLNWVSSPLLLYQGSQ
jgi:hypothetical protein